MLGASTTRIRHPLLKKTLIVQCYVICIVCTILLFKFNKNLIFYLIHIHLPWVRILFKMSSYCRICKEEEDKGGLVILHAAYGLLVSNQYCFATLSSDYFKSSNKIPHDRSSWSSMEPIPVSSSCLYGTKIVEQYGFKLQI